MQGGVHPDLPITYYEDLLKYLKSEYPEIHLHAFSPPEIKFIAKKERMSFAVSASRLAVPFRSPPSRSPSAGPTAGSG